MGSLTKKPATLPKEPYDVPVKKNEQVKKNNEVDKKSEKKTSLGLTIDTKKKINTLRKMKDFKNVDDLLLYLIEQEIKNFTDKEKMEFEIISKNI